MANGIVCDVCGGEEFHKESGFYYCMECQTQTQQLEEHVHENNEEFVQLKKSKKINKQSNKKKEREKNDLTSFESFNYVLVGLTDELIKLGADPAIKIKAFELWMLYLKKEAFFSNCHESRPKLSAAPYRRDVEIIYGHKRKRRYRKKSPASSVSDISIQSERRRRKKILINAEYSLIAAENVASSSSVVNVSLSSVKSSTELSNTPKAETIKYNRPARKELLKHMSHAHMREHAKDKTKSMSCHKSYSKCVSASYLKSAHHLTRLKIYAIVYLALLKTGDKIQLGDLLRFYREGYLCFTRFRQFFPEQYSDDAINLNLLQNVTRTMFSRTLREATAQFVKCLDVSVPSPDFVAMAERYCLELNLPLQITEIVCHLIKNSNIKMKLKKKSCLIPNYEGRVMGFIIFTLKLLFGLDDKTENKLSTYADKLNSGNAEGTTFNWTNWREHIAYRFVILKNYHLPTMQLFNSKNPNHVKTFIAQNKQQDIDASNKGTTEGLFYFLNKLRSTRSTSHINFPHSVTPFFSYVEYLLAHDHYLDKTSCAFDLLQRNFRRDNVDFLLHPLNYHERLIERRSQLCIKHGGANTKWLVKSADGELQVTHRNFSRLFLVNYVPKDSDIKSKRPDRTVDEENDKTNVLINKFATLNKRLYEDSLRKQYKDLINHNCDLCYSNATEETVVIDGSDNVSSVDSSNHSKVKFVQYNPYEMYWIRLGQLIDKESVKTFKHIENELPQSLKFVLKECARIIDQKNVSIYRELNKVELYYSYINNKGDHLSRGDVFDNKLKTLIKLTESTW